jgi:hypothetical protein
MPVLSVHGRWILPTYLHLIHIIHHCHQLCDLLHCAFTTYRTEKTLWRTAGGFETYKTYFKEDWWYTGIIVSYFNFL